MLLIEVKIIFEITHLSKEKPIFGQLFDAIDY